MLPVYFNGIVVDIAILNNVVVVVFVFVGKRAKWMYLASN